MKPTVGARNILVVSDNLVLAQAMFEIARDLGLDQQHRFDYACSPDSPLRAASGLPFSVRALKIAAAETDIAASYQLIISAHCKQLFPSALVRRVRCVNVHPGLNPHNRGWYPQVFSILNKRPLGATLHVIDEQLDHGPIIAQKEVVLHAWDTSLTAYNRVVEAELELLRQHLPAVIAGTFTAYPPTEEGNVNLKKDFATLCRLDLETVGTFGAHLDRLRALTHGDFKNAYFIDPQTGRKIFVHIQLTPEPNS